MSSTCMLVGAGTDRKRQPGTELEPQESHRQPERVRERARTPPLNNAMGVGLGEWRQENGAVSDQPIHRRLSDDAGERLE